MQPRAPYLRLIASGGELVTPAGTTLAEQLLDYVGVERGLRVVEFTYGPGRLGWRLQASGCSVTAVDLAVLSRDGIPDHWQGAFDVAFIPCVLHQAADPTTVLAEIASCVKPGGICGGLEPIPDEFEVLDIPAYARNAGLDLVDVFEPSPNAALFWRGQVPALVTRPHPYLTLVA